MKNIKDLQPNKNSKFKQGYYEVVNKEKYIGDYSRVIYRSGWEHMFLHFCDTNPSIIRWSSEPGGIQYVSPLDERNHTYFPDFFIKIQQGDGVIKEYLLDIKPQKDVTPPHLNETKKPTAKQLKRYNESVQVYITNAAKFSAAKEFCKLKGWEFIILTEQNFNFKT